MSRHYGAGNNSGAGGSGAQAPNVELEQQFILRLPTEPAAALREAIRSGASNIKDRLKVKTDFLGAKQFP